MFNFASLRTLLQSVTIKQSSITIIGTFLNGIIGVVFYILAARLLSADQLGIFSFITVAVALVASVANVGTDTGVTKFVAEAWPTSRSRALSFLKAGFYIKLLGWCIVLVFGILFSELITADILKKPELLVALRVSLIGVGGSMLFSYGASSLQALQRFVAWSFINIFGNALRLLFFLGLILFGFEAFGSAVWMFILLPFVGFFISLRLLPSFFGSTLKTNQFSEFFHFNKWVALTTVVVAVSSRLDSLFGARFMSLSDLGYYSVAVSLAGFISQIVLALGTVAAPKFASFKKVSDARRYYLKLQGFVIALSAAGVPFGIAVAYYLVPRIYGDSFIASVPPLMVLIAAYAVFLIAMPVHTLLLYYFSDSRFFTALAIVHIAVTVVCGFTLIPVNGMMGAAYTVLIGMVVNFLVPLIYALFKLK